MSSPTGDGNLLQEDLLRPSSNCWRLETASRFAVIIDADAYFRAVRESMTKASRRIMLVGWDFDARIALLGPGDSSSESLGSFILNLVDRTPTLHIHVLRWDIGGPEHVSRAEAPSSRSCGG